MAFEFVAVGNREIYAEWHVPLLARTGAFATVISLRLSRPANHLRGGLRQTADP